MTRRVSKAVPLPLDAATDDIINWCAGTTDLVAFRTALTWIDSGDWPDASARLERLLAEGTVAAPVSGFNAADRDARGRRIARAHKIQLLRASDATRRSNDQLELRRSG